nr:stress response protein NST1-like [Aedes albopictus]
MPGQCKRCNESDNDEMVACDACTSWYHFACVGESPGVANRSFCCPVCVEKKKKGKKGQKGKSTNQLDPRAKLPETSNDASSTKSVSSKKSATTTNGNDRARTSRDNDATSVASHASRASESRVLLEFRRMEEELALREQQLENERQMREKKLEIEKQFIQRKMQQERELREKELAQEQALLEKQLAEQVEFQNRQRELRERFQREKFEILSANLELEGAVGGLLPGVEVAQDNQQMVEAWLDKDKTTHAATQQAGNADAKSTTQQCATMKQVLETPKRHPEVPVVPPGVGNPNVPNYQPIDDLDQQDGDEADSDDTTEDDDSTKRKNKPIEVIEATEKINKLVCRTVI